MELEPILIRIEEKLDTQADKISSLSSQVSEIKAANTQQEKRVDLFWSKDWPGLICKIDKVENMFKEQDNRLRHVESEVSKIAVKIAVGASIIAAIFSSGGTIYINYLENSITAKVNEISLRLNQSQLIQPKR